MISIFVLLAISTFIVLVSTLDPLTLILFEIKEKENNEDSQD